MNAAPKVRRDAMLSWETAPAARICHEEQDHLVPLFVAFGAAAAVRSKYAAGSHKAPREADARLTGFARPVDVIEGINVVNGIKP